MKVDQARDTCHDRALLVSLLMVLLAWVLVMVPPVTLRAGMGLPALFVYSALSSVCHQLPQRSFQWFGFPLPLCARCTGLLLGFTLGALWGLRRFGRERPSLPRRRWLFGSGALLMADFLAPLLGLYGNTHITRLITGSLFGLLMADFSNVGVAEMMEIIKAAWKRKALA